VHLLYKKRLDKKFSDKEWFNISHLGSRKQLQLSKIDGDRSVPNHLLRRSYSQYIQFKPGGERLWWKCEWGLQQGIKIISKI